MVSILSKLETMQKDYAENLQQILSTGEKELQENSQKVLNKMEQNNETINNNFKIIEKIIKESSTNSQMDLINTMEKIENRTSVLIDKTRKGALINYWIDVFKYGLGTAICIVPVYMLFNFIINLI